VATAVDSPAQAPSADALRRARRRAEAWTPTVLCFVLAVLVAVAAYRSGGYFSTDYLPLGAAALGAAAVGLLLVGDRWRPSPLALVAIGSLCGLAAWTGLSALWSPDPAGATLAMGRTLGYAAVFLLATLAIGDGRRAALLLRLVVGVLIGVGVVALVSRLSPESLPSDSVFGFSTQGRLGSVITYSNGLGCVTAMAIVGAAGLGAEPREPAVVRAIAVAGGVLCVGAMYLTLSRGTGLALVLALTAILATSPYRLRLAVSTALVLGGGALAILILRHHPILVDTPGAIAEQQHQGHAVLWPLIAIAVATGALQIAAGRLPWLRGGRGRKVVSDDWHGDTWRPPTSSAATLVPVGVVLLCLLGTYAAVGDRLEGRTSEGTSSVRSYVDRQYSSFMNPVTADLTGQQRLTTTQSSRSDAYRVALNGFKAHPLAGDGAAGYRVRWFQERRGPESIRNAHSLELETISELGIVGGALLAGLLAALMLSLRSMARRVGPLRRTQAAGAGGIVIVYLVHSALDWDWQLAAVTMPALACGAVAMARLEPKGRSGSADAGGSGRRRRSRRSGRSSRSLGRHAS
jgi:O-antigen ligase